jgi:hypothetical protein
MIELEKKWLLKGTPKNLNELSEFEFVKGEFILQSYLSETERIRYIQDPEGKEDDKYQHFFKTRTGNGSAVEELTSITKQEHLEYHTKAIRELSKTRATFKHLETGLNFELDLIEFELAETGRVNILLLEVEFQDTYNSMAEVDENFVMPDIFEEFVLMDVTDNKNFSNFSLAEPIE